MDLAQRLAEGVSALREGRAAAAAELLEPVATDPELAGSAELRNIYARVSSLYAQALLESGRPAAARVPVRAALDALSRLGDAVGTRVVTQLQERIAEAIAANFQDQARQRALRELAKRDPEELLAEFSTIEAKLPVMVKRANAARVVGDWTLARELGHRAAALADGAGDTRHFVLATILLAEVEPELAMQHLERARRRADAADEFNLVGAVAKAAAAAGVELPPAGPTS